MEAEPETPWFRELYEAILGYGGSTHYGSVLRPWMAQSRLAVTQMDRFKRASRFDTTSNEFLLANWNLYALSRVNDLLLLPSQSDERGVWTGPQIAPDQYAEFFTELGFTPYTSEKFTPFDHEIVAVEQALDRAEPITIRTIKWPGLMFGEMLFSRSGVTVRGGSDHIVKSIAEQSALYFTHRRLHRRTIDLSQGWGSNSQWRTRFRRDYAQNGKRIYNIDGINSLNEVDANQIDDYGLTMAERLELCRNRCFIVTAKDDTDLWPFDDGYEELVCE